MPSTRASGRVDKATEEEFLHQLYRGGELLAAGKADEAKGHLEKAYSLQPKNEKGQNLLGLTYFKLGMFDQATAIYEALVRENPADPTLRVNLGLVYLKTNGLPRAIREFETATDLAPDHKKAHNYLGLALAQAGDYAKAREHFVEAGSEVMAEKMAKAVSGEGTPRPAPAPQPLDRAQALDRLEGNDAAREEGWSVTQRLPPEVEPAQVSPPPPPPPPAEEGDIEVMSDEERPPSEPIEEPAPVAQPKGQPTASDWGSQFGLDAGASAQAAPPPPPPEEDEMRMAADEGPSAPVEEIELSAEDARAAEESGYGSAETGSPVMDPMAQQGMDPMAGADPMAVQAMDPMADPMAQQGMDPLAGADPMADPMAQQGMDPMAADLMGAHASAESAELQPLDGGMGYDGMQRAMEVMAAGMATEPMIVGEAYDGGYAQQDPGFTAPIEQLPAGSADAATEQSFESVANPPEEEARPAGLGARSLRLATSQPEEGSRDADVILHPSAAGRANTSVAPSFAPGIAPPLVELGQGLRLLGDALAGPFHVSDELVAVVVQGELLSRLSGLVAWKGALAFTPECKRFRGRATDKPFGASGERMMRLVGKGVALVETAKRKFQPVDLDDESGYFREAAVFAFEEPVAFENGRMPSEVPPDLDLVHLRGKGRVLLQLEGPLRSLEVRMDAPVSIPLEHLIGWHGSVTPKLVSVAWDDAGKPERTAVELSGEGFALFTLPVG